MRGLEVLPIAGYLSTLVCKQCSLIGSHSFLNDNNKAGRGMYVNKLQLVIYNGSNMGDLPKNFARVA